MRLCACTSEGREPAEIVSPADPGRQPDCGLQWAIQIWPLSMTKVGKTALNNELLVILCPEPLWAKVVAGNPKDTWRKLNLDVWVLGMAAPVWECPSFCVTGPGPCGASQ